MSIRFISLNYSRVFLLQNLLRFLQDFSMISSLFLQSKVLAFFNFSLHFSLFSQFRVDFSTSSAHVAVSLSTV